MVAAGREEVPPDLPHRHLAERRALARGGALSFVGSTGSAALGFVLVLVAARQLGESGAGVLLQVIGLFTIATVLAKGGMDSAALWLLPRLAERDPSALRRHVVFVLVAPTCLGVVVGGAAAGMLAGQAAERGLDPQLLDALRLVSWFLPAGVAVLVSLSVVRALGAVGAYVLLGNLGLPLLRLGAVVAAASLGAGAVGVSTSWAWPLLPVLAGLLVVVWWRVRKAESPHGGTGGLWPHREERRPVVRFAAPRTVAAGAEQAIAWLDVVIVGALLGPVAAGVYGAASRFIAAGLVVDTALRVIVSPRFSLLLHRHDRDGVQDLYRTATTWLVLFATPGFLLLSLYPSVVLGWLGDGFTEGSTALVVLSTGAVVAFLAGNIHSLLLMSGHSGWAAVNKIVALTVIVTGCLLLVPPFGVVGAAAAWASAVVTDAALATWQVHLLLGVRPEVGAGLGALTLGAVAVGVPALLVRWQLGQTDVALLVSAAVGLALFGATTCLWRERLRLSGLVRDAS